MSDFEFKALEFERQRKETVKRYEKHMKLIYVSLLIILFSISAKAALARMDFPTNNTAEVEIETIE